MRSRCAKCVRANSHANDNFQLTPLASTADTEQAQLRSMMNLISDEFVRVPSRHVDPTSRITSCADRSRRRLCAYHEGRGREYDVREILDLLNDYPG